MELVLFWLVSFILICITPSRLFVGLDGSTPLDWWRKRRQ